jgi:hypothetical protein
VVFRAINKPFRIAIAGLIASLISVSTTYILSHFMGLTGAALGALVMDILLAFYILPYSSKLLGQNIFMIPLDFFNNDYKVLLKMFNK